MYDILTYGKCYDKYISFKLKEIKIVNCSVPISYANQEFFSESYPRHAIQECVTRVCNAMRKLELLYIIAPYCVILRGVRVIMCASYLAI